MTSSLQLVAIADSFTFWEWLHDNCIQLPGYNVFKPVLVEVEVYNKSAQLCVHFTLLSLFIHRVVPSGKHAVLLSFHCKLNYVQLIHHSREHSTCFSTLYIYVEMFRHELMILLSHTLILGIIHVLVQ